MLYMYIHVLTMGSYCSLNCSLECWRFGAHKWSTCTCTCIVHCTRRTVVRVLYIIMANRSATLAARLYLASVYHDVRILSPHDVPPERLSLLLSRLFYVYFEGYAVVSRCNCRASFHDWRPSMGHAVALLHRPPNLIHPISDFGFWRAAALRDLSSPPFAYPDHSWAEVLRLAPSWSGAHSSGEGGAFGCWFELSVGSGIAINIGRSLRVTNRSELVSAFGLNISSIFEQPVRGREHLWHGYRRMALSSASAGGIKDGIGDVPRGNVSHWPPPLYVGIALEDEAALRHRYFDNAPWRLEAKVDFCEHARRQGYDSIQIEHELCSMDPTRSACGVEIVSCHTSCLALRTRADRRVCVPHMPLRTGHDLSLVCHCNATGHPQRLSHLRSMLNCAGNRASLIAEVQRAVRTEWQQGVTTPPDTSPRRDRRALQLNLVPGRPRPFMFWLKECACAWCEGNHSHVDRLTQA